MPGLSIANNLLANQVQYNLDKNQAALQNTVTQLSSGLRINSAADDPSGNAIATNLQTQVDAFNQVFAERSRREQRGTSRARRALHGNRHPAAHPRPSRRSGQQRQQPVRHAESAGRNQPAASGSQPHRAEHQLQRCRSARRQPLRIPGLPGLDVQHHVERRSGASGRRCRQRQSRCQRRNDRQLPDDECRRGRRNGRAASHQQEQLDG